MIVLRFVLALVSFAIGLLAIAPTPTVPLFKLSVGATEFGHWLVLLPLLLLALGPWRGLPAIASVVLALGACALLLSSAVRAQRLARTLPAEMERALAIPPSAASAAAPPLAWRRLWFPPAIAPVKRELHEFAEHDGAHLAFHFYRSPAPALAPCVLVIHGGGWEGGSPDEFAAFNHLLARRGYAVAAVPYRLAPRWPWPAQRDDVLAALRCLKERSAELGIDARKFVLMGRSAGGQIAAAVAYSAHDPAIRGCIAFYAPADLHFAHEFARDDDIISSLGLVVRYLGGRPTEVRANYDSASAILLADRTSPPTLLLHGRRDPYVWYLQSQRLAARLEAAGVRHYFLDLPWATHGFDFNPHGPGGQLSVYAVGRFLAAVTR